MRSIYRKLHQIKQYVLGGLPKTFIWSTARVVVTVFAERMGYAGLLGSCPTVLGCKV
jgi:hypothetical protein